MLKPKLQYFGHLMWRADSLEKTVMLGKTEGRRRRGPQRMRWLDGISDSMDMSHHGRCWLVTWREKGQSPEDVGSEPRAHTFLPSTFQPADWERGCSDAWPLCSFKKLDFLVGPLLAAGSAQQHSHPPPVTQPAWDALLWVVLWGKSWLTVSLGEIKKATLDSAPWNTLAFLSYCCCNMYHKRSGLKQHKCITVYTCQSEVSLGWNQGIGRAVFLLEPRGESVFLPF